MNYYYYLNLDKFKDPRLFGKENDIGSIIISFHEEVFRDKNYLEMYRSISTKDPQFKNIIESNDERVVFDCFVDNNNYSIEQVRTIIEKLEQEIIPSFNKSLNDMGMFYEFVVCMSNNDVENAYKNWMVEENIQQLQNLFILLT